MGVNIIKIINILNIKNECMHESYYLDQDGNTVKKPRFLLPRLPDCGINVLFTKSTQNYGGL